MMTMTDETGDENLLVRYLLGGLPEEEQLLVEELFLRDDQCYERLLALENELFYDYAQGKLPRAEREQFEKRFLTSEQNRKKAALAAGLMHKLSATTPAEVSRPVLANRKPQIWLQSLKSYFCRRTSMGLSLAALAAALCVSTWLVLEMVKLRTEFDRLQTQRAAQEERLQQQVQQERSRADELNLRLKREQDENAVMEQELDIIQARFQRQGWRYPTTMSFVLAPSFIRSENNNLKRLYLPPMTRLLKLQLNLKGEVDYRSYQAILSTAEGAERWRREMLIPEPRGSGQALVLKLPARLLDAGDYELKVKGLAAGGTLEETGDYYYFSILKATTAKEP